MICCTRQKNPQPNRENEDQSQKPGTSPGKIPDGSGVSRGQAIAVSRLSLGCSPPELDAWSFCLLPYSFMIASPTSSHSHPSSLLCSPDSALLCLLPSLPL